MWFIVFNNVCNCYIVDVVVVCLIIMWRIILIWVVMGFSDLLIGYVNVDNIEIFGKDEFGDYFGEVMLVMMNKINMVFVIVLGLLWL